MDKLRGAWVFVGCVTTGVSVAIAGSVGIKWITESLNLGTVVGVITKACMAIALAFWVTLMLVGLFSNAEQLKLVVK